MTKTELHKAIEHHYGSGILMAFTDLIHEEREMVINCSKCGKDVSEAGAFGSDGFVCFDHPNCKPRTRTEYVKVEPSVLELGCMFEAGELYHYHGGEYLKITQSRQAFFHAHNLSLHRKVETPITEREEFIEQVKGLIDASKDADYSLGRMFDAGCRFKTDKE